MHYFVVAGIMGCRKFATVLSVAEYLEKKYSYVIFHRISVKQHNWQEWLKIIRKKNGWNHFSLPIIWKELPFRGGKQSLIGGYNDFLEYCNEVYQIEVSFSKTLTIHQGFQSLKKEIQYEKLIKLQNTLPRQVCIYGAGSVLVPLFLPWLLSTPDLATDNGLVVGLYDEDISKRELLDSIVEEFGCIVPQNSRNMYFRANIINDIATAMKSCELFILIIPELLQEYKEYWSQSVSYATRAGHALASSAKKNVRVVVVPESLDTPVCLCAAAFSQAAMPNVISQNVVAITSTIGIMIRSMLSYSLQIPLHLVQEVPVWGFIGVSHLLDPSLTVTDNENIYSELAKEFLSNPLFKNNFLDSYLWPLFGRRKEIMEIMLKRKPLWATVDALLDIINKWYSKETTKRHAFLGIHSDGTFGIPRGIYFSQPAFIIDDIWRPFKEYSLPTDPFCKIKDLCNTAVLLTEIYLNKDKFRYRLTGLNVEANDSYFDIKIEGDETKFYSSSYQHANRIEDYKILMHEQEVFVKNFAIIIINKILADLLQVIGCFSTEDNYDFVSALIRESIVKKLKEKQLEKLIPCFFPPDDLEIFLKEYEKNSISKILTNMNYESLIPCIFPDDNTYFIVTIMKELIYGCLEFLQQKELMPCIFP